MDCFAFLASTVFFGGFFALACCEALALVVVLLAATLRAFGATALACFGSVRATFFWTDLGWVILVVLGDFVAAAFCPEGARLAADWLVGAFFTGFFSAADKAMEGVASAADKASTDARRMAFRKRFAQMFMYPLQPTRLWLTEV